MKLNIDEISDLKQSKTNFSDITRNEIGLLKPWMKEKQLQQNLILLTVDVKDAHRDWSISEL